jgi:hypothetical protein
MKAHDCTSPADPQALDAVLAMAKENANTTISAQNFILKQIGWRDIFIGGASPFDDELSADPRMEQAFVDGAKAMYTAVLVGTWTAFEVLATDLWKTSVNLNPMSLGVNALLARKPKEVNTDNDVDEDRRSEKDTPINLNTLKEYKFDLGSKLGTMIWSKRKFNFNSLDGLTYAYYQTFCMRQNGSRVATLPEVKAWFSGGDHEKLRVLEATRNVFVHRAGKADQTFVDRVRDRYPVFSGVEVDSAFPLDGDTLRDLVDATVRRAIAIVEGVDQWIKKPK